MSDQRVKDRIKTYLNGEIKNPDQIVSSLEVTEYLKRKYNEYTRREVKAFERQIKSVIDAMFADVNATNIRKSFYKKRDMLAGMAESED